MRLFVDVRGTLMLRSPGFKVLNGELASALAQTDAEEIIVWSWLDDEAERAAKALVSMFPMPCPVNFMRKEYGLTKEDDRIIDDRPDEWADQDYTNGASVWTPEEYVLGKKR